MGPLVARRGPRPAPASPDTGSRVHDEADIAVTRTGTGPEVLLVHGGASAATTWSGLERLGERWTLTYAHRRGYPPSPPPLDDRQDFEVDAADLAPLLDDRPHLVAHSYGAVGAVIAAASRPARVRSLTLLEPAIFEPEEVKRGVRRAQGSRPPGEACLPLHALARAGIPTLVASGDHVPVIERMCDAVAAALNARRVITPGAGHFVAAAPEFPGSLERFLLEAR